MHKGTYFALAAITVVGGFALGRAFKSSGDNEATTGTVETAPSPMPPVARSPATWIASGCRWRASSAARPTRW